jgi:hypothetical protein
MSALQASNGAQLEQPNNEQVIMSAHARAAHGAVHWNRNFNNPVHQRQDYQLPGRYQHESNWREDRALLGGRGASYMWLYMICVAAPRSSAGAATRFRAPAWTGHHIPAIRATRRVPGAPGRRVANPPATR